MGTIVKRGKSFRAVVRKKGDVVTKTFTDAQIAREWIEATEFEIGGPKHGRGIVVLRETVQKLQSLKLSDCKIRLRQARLENAVLLRRCEELAKERNGLRRTLAASRSQTGQVPADEKARSLWTHWPWLSERIQDALLEITSNAAAAAQRD